MSKSLDEDVPSHFGSCGMDIFEWVEASMYVRHLSTSISSSCLIRLVRLKLAVNVIVMCHTK